MGDDKGGYRQINKSLNICAFDDYLKGQTARLPQLANVEQLSPKVLRVLGQNPGKVSAASTIPGIKAVDVQELTLLPSLRIKEPIHTSSAPVKCD